MKKLTLTACTVLLSIFLIQAQEKNKENQIKENIHVKVKDNAKLDIYVDGKKFDFPMELLDKNRIESVNILKSEKAIKEYDAKNGVVLITTKNSDNKITEFNSKEEKKKNPMVIIDGEESEQETLNNLSPNDIESINVIKGEQAMKKYKAAHGVIIVKTKEGNKK
jgi:ribosomal protein S8